MGKFEILSKRIDTLKDRIKLLDLKKKVLEGARQEVCLHKSIKRSGGEDWFDYYERPNHGHNSWVLECLDCGLFGTSNRYNGEEENPRYPIYEMLDKIYRCR